MNTPVVAPVPRHYITQCKIPCSWGGTWCSHLNLSEYKASGRPVLWAFPPLVEVTIPIEKIRRGPMGCISIHSGDIFF